MEKPNKKRLKLSTTLINSKKGEFTITRSDEQQEDEN